MPPRSAPTIPLSKLLSAYQNDCLMLESYARLGPVVRTSFIYPQYFINEAESISQILLNQKGIFDKDRVGISRLAQMIGPGLISHPDQRWQEIRPHLGHPFKADHFEPLMPTFHDIIQSNILTWPHDKGSYDLLPHCLTLALEVNAYALTQQRLESNAHQYAHHITQAVHHGCRAFSLKAGWPSFHKWQFQRIAKPLHAWADGLLWNLLNANEAPHALLRPLVEAYQAGKIPWATLSSEFKTLLFAGYEATGVAIAWLLYHLATNPYAYEKVRQEILGAFPKHQAIDTTTLKKGGYTTLAIAESLRLSPPIYVMERRCHQPVNLCGYLIPKGSLLIISPYTIQRHPDYWEHPTRFLPERFLHTPPSQSPKGSYLPYGLGPRSCIGMSLAKVIVKTALITCIQHITWTKCTRTPIMGTGQITLKPKNGIWLSTQRSQ